METQLSLFPSMPYNGHAGFARRSKTSKLAAIKATVTRVELYKRILDCYDVMGSMTADTCARYLNVHFMRVRPRCTELTHEGYLAVDDTLEGVSALGNPQNVLTRTYKRRSAELQ